MQHTKTRFWGGLALIVLATIVLFSSIVIETSISGILLVAVVAALAAGSLLVGLSERGRGV